MHGVESIGRISGRGGEGDGGVFVLADRNWERRELR